MKVALVLGKAQGDSVKPRLKSIKDNLDIDTYDGIEDFIIMATKRNTIYDRIVLLSSKVNQKNLQDLYMYWGDTSKETSLVFMGKAGVDQGKAQAFLDLFKTPVVASMLVPSTTVALLAESVLLPPSDLTERYGIKDFLKYEVDDTAIDAAALLAASQPKPAQPTQPNQAPQNQQVPPVQGAGEEPKEKRTLFGSLFGSKKEKSKKGKTQHQNPSVAGQPGMNQAGMNQGGMPQPGVGQLGMNQAGMNQAGVGQQAPVNAPQGQHGYQQMASAPGQGFNNQGGLQGQTVQSGYGQAPVQGVPQGYGQSQATPQGYGQSQATPPGYGQSQATLQGVPQGYPQPQTMNQDMSQPIPTMSGFGDQSSMPESVGVQPNVSQGFGGAVSEPQTYPQSIVDNVDNFSQPEAKVPNMQTEQSFQQNPTPTWSQTQTYGEPVHTPPVAPQPSAPQPGFNTYQNPQSQVQPAMNMQNPHQGFSISQQVNQQVPQPQPSPVASTDLEEDFGARDFVSVGNTVNDFAPETDLDFGANAGLYHSSPRTPASKTQQEIEEVEFSDSSMDIAAAEQRYQAQNVRVEVREKVVVKEVGGGSTGVLKAIRAGRMKKVLIVTGDRATGVTSTAYAIANYMAKTTTVLYFDCDIQNHGLLNYIDYGQFRNYENIHHNGVPSCKSNKAFQRCVIPWAGDLYLLTSDYTSECSPEDISTAQEVVAETYSEFGLTVVDCPMAYLQYIPDLIMQGSTVICVEGSKRGMMNMLCQLESNEMPMKSKRAIAQKGNFFMTKCTKSTDLKKLVNYIQNFYEPDGVNWLSIPYRPFMGKLDDKLLAEILEG